MDAELRGKIEACCRTAEEFTKLYYKSFDKSRHQMNRLYLDTGVFVWNGSGALGKDNIQKLQIELPSSEHNLYALDAQPIIDDAVAGQLTYAIQTGGTVKYMDNPVKQFQQTFIITAQGDKWKIASDSYRLQDAIATADK
ncbi:NTF2-related export protein [Episyrphus balteatus]|uniref:NTF2-related export protein n=1 Tax=Episyrphus balteatus TaxID=286459 RepID=UPI002484EB86|nr:NTF2-related export protein [Episyrphus balteatus]